MFEIEFDVQGSEARTLSPDEVCKDHGSLTGESSCTHADGWTIQGVICEDYFYWVNNFEAQHPTFGRVWGNFEDKVFADSKEGYDAFCAAHGPQIWDYGDI